MIDSILQFSLKNRFLVIFAVLLIAALGVRAAVLLPIDAVPDVTNVQVQVLTTAPALAPEEVEQFITFPVESVMSGIPKLEQVRSVSRFGLSAVTLVFEDGTDIYFARQLVQERLAEAREQIPEGFGSPEMGPISSGLGEIYQFEVKGEPMCGEGQPDTDRCYTAMELRTILDWFIAYQLRSVEGVVEINSMGGHLRTFEVQLDPDRLVALGVTLDEVFEALERNNANSGGGYIVHGGEQRLIRGEALVRTLEDIGQIVVATRGQGTAVRVADLGRVADAPAIRQGAVTRDGRGDIVTGTVMMLMGANSREVVQDVDERIQEIKPTLPPGVTIDTYYDRTDLVMRTIRTVAINLLEGGALVIVVLLLMLGNVRGGILVATAIPIAMLATFIGMRWLGLSGNLMSLGAIDFGLIVDGPVVVVEHIMRVLSERKSREADVRPTIFSAVDEVIRPVIFAVAIIMVVYVPVLTLQGIEGKMFRPMAITVMIAIGASLILAMTWMPAISTLLFKKGVTEKETFVIRGARRLYDPALRFVLQHQKLTVLIAAVLFLLSLITIPFLGAEFVPKLDEGAIAMQAIRLPSVSLEESIAANGRVERAIRQRFPNEVSTVISRTGRAEIATDPMGVDVSDIYVLLHPEDRWRRAEDKADLVAKIEALLEAEVPGQRYSFSQPIELRTNELISGVRSDVAISVYGDDLEELRRVGDRIVAIVSSVPGAADVRAEAATGLPMLRVRVDRQRIGRYGINAAQVLDVVAAMGGRPVGEVFEGQKRFVLQVRFQEEARSSLDRIRNVPVRTPDGALVPLGQLASIALEEGPAQISRDRIQRKLTIEANVRGRDLAGFVDEAQRRVLAEGRIPPGYFVDWGGQFENLAEASIRLAIAVPTALFLIFAILFAMYRSTRPAVIIFLNVPFAATGGLLALTIRGLPFSVSAGVGFIALFGIAVLNGVVLVSAIRTLQQQDGLARELAVVTGARERLRPVLTTALVASLGFVPMALSSSAGAEVQRPLATVVIGGLITSTLLTLLVLPAVYAWLGGKRETRESWTVPPHHHH
jgi:cobalt-zinc-cadmium resistance protein CzcA